MNTLENIKKQQIIGIKKPPAIKRLSTGKALRRKEFVNLTLDEHNWKIATLKKIQTYCWDFRSLREYLENHLPNLAIGVTYKTYQMDQEGFFFQLLYKYDEDTGCLCICVDRFKNQTSEPENLFSLSDK